MSALALHSAVRAKLIPEHERENRPVTEWGDCKHVLRMIIEHGVFRLCPATGITNVIIMGDDVRRIFPCFVNNGRPENDGQILKVIYGLVTLAKRFGFQFLIDPERRHIRLAFFAPEHRAELESAAKALPPAESEAKP